MTIRKKNKQDARPRRVVTCIAMTCIAAWATTWIPRAAANPQVIDDVDPLLRDQVLQDLNVADFSLQQIGVLDDNEDRIETQIELDGRPVTMTLIRHSNRAPGFRVLVDNGTGVLEEIDPEPPQTYRGAIAERPEAIVAASIIQGQLSAMIYGGGEEWRIQPLSQTIAGTDPTLHVFYRAADVLPTGDVCGNEDGFDIDAVEDDVPNPPQGRTRPQEELNPDGEPSARQYDGGGTLAQAAGIHIAEIAIDVDFDLFNRLGSTGATTIFVEEILNNLNVIYTRDAGICHSITTIIIRTNENTDPYNGITDSSVLLCAFRSHWNANHDNINRVVAHLMTGKNLDGNIIGRAKNEEICSLDDSCDGPEDRDEYGLSAVLFSNNTTQRVALVAHELGHNWSARHCDQEGDSCRGNPDDCRIMCTILGGCSGILTSFSPESAQCVIDFRNVKDEEGECLTEGCDCGFSFERFSLLVPINYPTIGDALDNASCGASILIFGGGYAETRLSHDLGGSVRLSAAPGGVVLIVRPP